jgi:hypothetical protein
MGTDSDGAGLVHEELIQLRATPAQVRDFITTPERIMAYNPDAIEGGVLEPGHSVWFRTETGVTVVERIEEACTDDCVVVRGTVAPGLVPPFTADDVRAAAMITLVEDWFLQGDDGGTTLRKTWRDVASSVDLPFSLEDSIRKTAQEETPLLVADWDEAARAAR